MRVRNHVCSQSGNRRRDLSVAQGTFGGIWIVGSKSISTSTDVFLEPVQKPWEAVISTGAVRSHRTAKWRDPRIALLSLPVLA